MNANFSGEYHHSVDTKGRFIIPSRFREQIGDRLIITRGLDGCLYLFTVEEWEKYQEKLQMLPVAQKKARDFVRFFSSAAVDCELDKQGRVLIPPSLRAFAKIDKDVVLAGMLNRIELWSQEHFDDENQFDDPEKMNQLSEDLQNELGFQF